jgi:glycosyltransferase involved in cell wall biosynthesis
MDACSSAASTGCGPSCSYAPPGNVEHLAAGPRGFASMTSLPVTVIIPAYNRAAMVERAIRSVRAQTVPPVEVLVIDDGSADDTAERAERAGARVVRLSGNHGAAGARNRGIQTAQTQWIAFLDSDDEWLPHHLETLWPFVQRYALVAGDRAPHRRRGRHRHGGRVSTTELTSPAQLIFPDNPISLGGVVVLRQLVTEIGGFNETLRISEDWDLWIRIVERQPAVLVHTPVYVYHHHAGQKTDDVGATREAQLALLEAFRGAGWWSDVAYDRRVALNWCESAIWGGRKAEALTTVLRGLRASPRIYWPVARMLARNSVAPRLDRLLRRHDA